MNIPCGDCYEMDCNACEYKSLMDKEYEYRCLRKIKITEIEATAEDLRQSNSVADALMNTLRNALMPIRCYNDEDECQEGDDE